MWHSRVKGLFCATALLVLALPEPGARAAVVDAPSSDIVPLWPQGAPDTPEAWKGPEFRGNESISNVTQPTLSIWRPAPGKANGTAVIVAPGGAFTGLAWNKEGAPVAQWLASLGVTAFVLKYRVHQMLPSEQREAVAPVRYEQTEHVKIGQKLAMEDGLQAVRLVRGQAARYGIDPTRIGFLGFSAGAMTAMNVVMKGDAAGRPDFVAPIYGAAPKVPVPQDAPPLFEVVATDDPIMFPRALGIFEQWTAAGKSAELHVYEKGGHGFGLGDPAAPVGHWPAAFAAWMADHGFLPQTK